MSASAPAVAFLVKTFPKLSETFVLGEVLGLERRGLSLAIFTLQPPAETVRHAAIARVRATVRHLNAPGEARRGALADHLAAWAAHPIGYLRAAVLCVRRREPEAWTDLSLACALARYLRCDGIRHVHAHFASQPAAVAELAARLVGGTYSISAHAKDIYVGDRTVLARKLGGARFTVTCTGHNHDHLRGIAPHAENLHLMYHGIDFDRFKPALRPAGDGTPTILAVGRLREKKGFATLVRACARLRDRGVDFACDIVGYGEDEAVLRALIETLRLGAQVRLPGRMNHETLVARYQSATVFAAPCRVAGDGDRDGIPNVLLEAMAMELPVVTTPVSGIPEAVVDGVTGVFVAPDDDQALADGLQRVLADAELRARLGRAAREHVITRFDNDCNLATVHALLVEAMRGPSRRPAREEKAYA